VTEVPTDPEVGDKPVMFGVTTNEAPLLDTLATVTTTLPVVAPLGTGTTMLVADQLVDVAAVPLNVTVPVEPKLAPEIVTGVRTVPEAGDRLVMLGTGFPVPVVPLA
jgi:hypothetical protein